MHDEIAVHEDDEIVTANAGARHGTQNQRDGDALAGLVLAHDAQGHIEIAGDDLEVVGDLVFVEKLAGAEPQGCGHASLADLLAEAAQHSFRNGPMLAESRHLDVDVLRPPAGVPQRFGLRALFRVRDQAEHLGAQEVVHPPAVPPDAEDAEHVGDLAEFAVEDLVRDCQQHAETGGEKQRQFEQHEWRPFLPERQRRCHADVADDERRTRAGDGAIRQAWFASLQCAAINGHAGTPAL